MAFSLRREHGPLPSLSPANWRLLLFVAHCRLPRHRFLSSVFVAAMLATGAGVHPAPDAPGRLCSLTVQSPPVPPQLAPALERVMVRARDQLIATATRLDRAEERLPDRFLLACGVYDVSVDGDAGSGVGSLVTTTVHLDRDKTITLYLR